jgi:branched-chain amino acid transport system substrate-binding protein
MKLTKLRWRALLLIAVFALVAAACGDDSAPATPETVVVTSIVEVEVPGETVEVEVPGETVTSIVEVEVEPMACIASIGTILPITGPVAFIGEVQLNWANYALDVHNATNGTSHVLVEGDNMFDVAQSSIMAAQIVDNQDIVAVVGPAGSDQVDSAGAAFDAGDPNLVYISPSSTRIGITALYNALFRTVGTDADQGPANAAFMIAQGATKVFMIDDQSSYSTGLADVVAAELTAGGVEVTRESVSQDVIDFSALVGTIADDTDWIYLPWQVAANGQILGNQLAEQDKDIPIFGSDGMDSGDFSIAGSVVSSFAADIAFFRGSAALLQGFLAEYPETNSFGPPVYVAMTVILEAVDRVCEAGDELTRANVLAEVRATDSPTSILAQPIRFTEDGDLVGGQFFSFEIQDDGTKVQVG